MGPLGLLSDLHEIFSNRNSASVSGKQPRATAIAYPVSGVARTSPSNNSKGVSSCLVLGGFLARYSVALMGSIVSPHGVASFKRHAYTYIHITVEVLYVILGIRFLIFFRYP